MPIRSFAGQGGANTLASLANSALLGRKQHLSQLDRGITGLMQIQPERELKEIMETTTPENLMERQGILASLASQASEPYQNQAAQMTAGIGGLEAIGIDKRNATTNEGTLKETIRHNKAMESMRDLPEYGLTSGKYGTWKWNKATGEAERLQDPMMDGVFGLFGGIEKDTPVMELTTGETVYMNPMNGQPIVDANGNHIVKSRSKFNLGLPEAQSQEQSMMDSIGRIENLIERSDGAMASFGSSPMDWTGNLFNDYIFKSPTEDRLAREKIKSQSEAMVATLRNAKESGVMTQADFERYRRLVPDVDTEPKEALIKLRNLRSDMTKYYSNKHYHQGTQAPYVPQTNIYDNAPPIGTISKGYEYIGGNPSDKASWRIVQ